MPAGDVQIGTSESRPTEATPTVPAPEFHLTLVDSPSTPVSIIKLIRERMREPRITVPQKYYRGEAALPVTEMPPWYRDIPNQFRALFEKPKPPLIPLTSKPIDVPDIWQDYKQQPGAWLNSLLVHGVALTALLLPFIIMRMAQPVKASSKNEVLDISPYLANLPPSAKKAGGGGGGGDRTPIPASKGPVPKFAKVQMAPPVTKLIVPNPQLPVQATLLGPPELQLPQMANSTMFGDPQSVLGPASNGPGSGGGIGTGTGTGIGSGTGGGLGPGEGGGTGGGAYSVGGNVSAPIPIYKPEPPYSEEARKAKFQGTVLLWIVVDAQGAVTDARVAKPLGLGLDEKALETVRTWKFKPAQRNGTPVPVHVMVEVSFRLF
jgi:protein TonB